MVDLENKYDNITSLNDMFSSCDTAIDETEDMDAVLKSSGQFSDYNKITPDMIEAFMAGKVEHINEVHKRSEEISAKMEADRKNRYGTTFQRLSNIDSGLKRAEQIKSEPETPEIGIKETKEIESIKGELSEIKKMMAEILASRGAN